MTVRVRFCPVWCPLVAFRRCCAAPIGFGGHLIRHFFIGNVIDQPRGCHDRLQFLEVDLSRHRALFESPEFGDLLIGEVAYIKAFDSSGQPSVNNIRLGQGRPVISGEVASSSCLQLGDQSSARLRFESLGEASACP